VLVSKEARQTIELQHYEMPEVAHLASVGTQDLHRAHDIHTRNNGTAYHNPGNRSPTPEPAGIYVARDASMCCCSKS
jgi:hypothetical protein